MDVQKEEAAAGGGAVAREVQMATQASTMRMFEGDGDRLMQEERDPSAERVILLPDAMPSKMPDPTPRLRIMWGQHLLEDLLAGRYRSLVCAVNAQNNERGIISQLATLLPTSQWDEQSITSYAAQFSTTGGRVKVLKFDLDTVEVLAILRPPEHTHLTLADLGQAFKVVAEMIDRKPDRLPSASVSFLEAHANALVDSEGREPSFEAVLQTMYEGGYHGDVYPSPSMWKMGEMGFFPRYPFAPWLDQMREGGF